ncbi:DUF6894 family protein [Bradyrhizobium sp. ORS 111]|uniref:DUF6894 family protein n=1 Tax=Bradyrhizobium sp. ORS 111 TaxID=1685958 RepID=UPI0038900ED2
MATYFFRISGAVPFFTDGGVDLRSDADAWNEALSLMRDVQESLSPGDTWELEVHRGTAPLFRIRVASERLR